MQREKVKVNSALRDEYVDKDFVDSPENSLLVGRSMIMRVLSVHNDGVLVGGMCKTKAHFVVLQI